MGELGIDTSEREVTATGNNKEWAPGMIRFEFLKTYSGC